MFRIRGGCLLFVTFLIHCLTVHGLRVFQEVWASKCKESGVAYNSTIDFQNYVEYSQCIGTAINTTQFYVDFEAIMQEINSAEPDYSTIRTTLQSYCAPAKAYTNCSKILSTECFSEEEMSRWNVDVNLGNALIDFFCDNDTMTEFIYENGFECYAARNDSINLCLTEFDKHKMIARFLNGQEVFALLYGIPKADIMCDLIRTAGNCILESFQSCERSTKPAQLVAKLIDYVEMGTKCSTQPKINSLERIKQSSEFRDFQLFFGKRER